MTYTIDMNVFSLLLYKLTIILVCFPYKQWQSRMPRSTAGSLQIHRPLHAKIRDGSVPSECFVASWSV